VSTVLALQTYKPLKWFKTTNKVENMYFQFFWNDRLLLRLEENIRTSKKYTTLLRNCLLQFVYCQEKK
jgi:hypothetical protein